MSLGKLFGSLTSRPPVTNSGVRKSYDASRDKFRSWQKSERVSLLARSSFAEPKKVDPKVKIKTKIVYRYRRRR